jgi:hypothetical protein
MMDRTHVVSGLVGGLLVAVILAGPSAIAAVGDALRIGALNTGNARTTVQGDTNHALVKIVNTQGSNDNALSLVSSGPNLQISNTRKINRLNADQVDDLSAREIVRAEHAYTEDGPDDEGEALGLTITAPVDGILLIGGEVNVGANDGYQCQLAVDGHYALDPGIRFDWDAKKCTTTAAFDVEAGTHDVGVFITAEDNVDVYETSLWAIFVPFDGTGARVVMP